MTPAPNITLGDGDHTAVVRKGLQGHVIQPRVLETYREGRDNSPMPSPPKKRWKVKQEEPLADFESEGERPILAAAVDELEIEIQGLDKRRHTESRWNSQLLSWISMPR